MEDLVINLFEIAKLNSGEELSYDDFEKELSNQINLPPDEKARALSLMLKQAENNPNIIGESKGGIFVFSNSYVMSIKTAIEYENQFIPGKKEFFDRQNSNYIPDITNIVIAGSVIDNMLNNFEKLSDNEKRALAKSFDDMDNDQQKQLFKNLGKSIRKFSEKCEEGPEKDFSGMIADTVDTAEGNVGVKPEDLSIEEKVATIAVLEHIYPEMISKIKEMPNFEEMSLDDIFRNIKEEIGRETAENATESDIAISNGMFKDYMGNKNIYEKWNRLFQSEVIISYIQGCRYKDDGFTITTLLDLSFDDILDKAIRSMYLKVPPRGEISADKDGSEVLVEVKLQERKLLSNGGSGRLDGKTENRFGENIMDKLGAKIPSDSIVVSILDRLVEESEITGRYELEQGVSIETEQNIGGNGINSARILSNNYATLNNINTLDSVVKNEIEQIPFVLLKAGFSVDDIGKAMKEYGRIVSEIEIKKKDNASAIDNRVESKIDEGTYTKDQKEILLKLNEIAFNGKKVDMLKTHKKEFLEEFNKVATNPEKYIQLTKGRQISLELESVFEEYFEKNSVEMDTSAISNEERKQGDALKTPQIDESSEDERYQEVAAGDSFFSKQAFAGIMDKWGGNESNLNKPKMGDIDEQAKLLSGLVMEYNHTHNYMQGNKNKGQTQIDSNGTVVPQPQETDNTIDEGEELGE